MIDKKDKIILILSIILGITLLLIIGNSISKNIRDKSFTKGYNQCNSDMVKSINQTGTISIDFPFNNTMIPLKLSVNDVFNQQLINFYNQNGFIMLSDQNGNQMKFVPEVKS